MSAERPVLDSDLKKNFIDLATSSRDHYDSFVMVWTSSLYDSQKLDELLSPRDFFDFKHLQNNIIERRLNQNANFATAYRDVTSGFAALSEPISEENSEIINLLRDDWKMKLWELGVTITNFPQYQEAYNVFRKLKEIDDRHIHEYGNIVHRPGRPCIERDVVIDEAIKANMGKNLNFIEKKFNQITDVMNKNGLDYDMAVVGALDEIVQPSGC